MDDLPQDLDLRLRDLDGCRLCDFDHDLPCLIVEILLDLEVLCRLSDRLLDREALFLDLDFCFLGLLLSSLLTGDILSLILYTFLLDVFSS